MFLRVIFALSCLATQCLGRVNDDYDNPDPNKDCDEKIEKRVGRLSKYDIILIRYIIQYTVR